MLVINIFVTTTCMVFINQNYKDSKTFCGLDKRKSLDNALSILRQHWRHLSIIYPNSGPNHYLNYSMLRKRHKNELYGDFLKLLDSFRDSTPLYLQIYSYHAYISMYKYKCCFFIH